MTPRAKYILTDAIHIFRAIPSDKKAELILSVQNNLKVHYNGLKTIGVGLEKDKVVAGEIFLRIFNK